MPVLFSFTASENSGPTVNGTMQQRQHGTQAAPAPVTTGPDVSTQHAVSVSTLHNYKAKDIPAYYRWLAPNLGKYVTTFTTNVSSLEYDKRLFNELMFVADVMQRVNCFTGDNMQAVVVRNSCASSETKRGKNFRSRVAGFMCPDYQPLPQTKKSGLRFIHTLDAASDVKMVESLDFDKVATECEALVELHLPATVITLGNHDQAMMEVDPRDLICLNDENTAYSGWCDAFLEYNEGSTAWNAPEQDPPLLQSSRALVDTVLDHRCPVPKLLTITILSKIADMTMLSLVVVLNTLAEVRSTSQFLRENIQFKNRKPLVCEFLVGAFSHDGSSCGREYVKACEQQTRTDLRETLIQRGIVVCLRRPDVLKNLNAEIISTKANRSEAPGNTICYKEDVKHLNNNIWMLTVTYKLTLFKKQQLQELVMAKVRSFGNKSATNSTTSSTASTASTTTATTSTASTTTATTSTASTTTATTSTTKPVAQTKPATKSTIHKKKAAARKFSRKSVQKPPAPPIASSGLVLEDVNAVEIDESTWPDWSFTDVVDPSVRGRYWRPRVAYFNTLEEEMEDEDVKQMRQETNTSLHWCEWYRQTLVAEKARLSEIQIPNCVGILLAMESSDMDDEETIAYTDALSGKCDPKEVMITPHCTVLLSHSPVAIDTDE